MKFEMYKITSTDDPAVYIWCWRLTDNNNKILAYSGTHYSSKDECEASIQFLNTSINRNVPIISISEDEPNLMSALLEKLFPKRKKVYTPYMQS